MTSKLSTDPEIFEIATPELIPIGVDFTSRLGSGETVASVVSRTVTHIASGTVIAAAISSSASLVSPIVTQVIDPSTLSRRGQYEYVVTVLIGTRRESTRTILQVMF